MSKLITDPNELSLIVKPTILGPDDPNQKPIGFSCREILPGSQEAVERDKLLDVTRWTATDETAKFPVGAYAVDFPEQDRVGWTSIPVLEFLWNRLWNNAVLNVIAALRPSSIRVTTGAQTYDVAPWRVNVLLSEDKKLIREITQEVEVGLIGCRHGADVSAYIENRVPSSVIINPRGIAKSPITKDEK